MKYRNDVDEIGLRTIKHHIRESRNGKLPGAGSGVQPATLREDGNRLEDHMMNALGDPLGSPGVVLSNMV
jgi:hypothetical protein